MTDILKRLRDQVELGTALEAEAADEIERLQRLVGDMLHAQHKQERTNVLQEAEIVRLRAALRLYELQLAVMR